MKAVILSMAMLFSFSAFAVSEAPAPKAVQEARKKLISEEVRTTMKSIMNDDGNPCLAEGKSYQVEVQVKKTDVVFNEKTGNRDLEYKWETVRTVVIDKDGGVMEVCLE